MYFVFILKMCKIYFISGESVFVCCWVCIHCMVLCIFLLDLLECAEL